MSRHMLSWPSLTLLNQATLSQVAWSSWGFCLHVLLAMLEALHAIKSMPAGEAAFSAAARSHDMCTDPANNGMHAVPGEAAVSGATRDHDICREA